MSTTWQEGHFRRRYGISYARYLDMVAEQDGLCYICGKPPTGKGLSVDHNHVTGEVRKLLCTNCNFAVGHILDNVEIAEKLLNYLREYNKSVQ